MGDDGAEHEWELAKENAAPLEKGRSAKTLRRAFGTSSAERVEIEEKTRKYEKLVRRSEKAVEWLQRQAERTLDGSGRELTDDEAQALRDRMPTELGFNPRAADRDDVDHDPLRYWVLYVKHIRESYPSDSQRQFLLMERCARTFMARPFLVPDYVNDVRYIRTCILYADKTSNPSEVFKLMSRIKVGTKVSLFWVAWAWVAEKAEDFQFTEKIFQKALKTGAEPRKFLEERQRQFLRRMSRHWLNASQVQEEEEDEGADGRGALNALTSGSVARNQRGGSHNREAGRQPPGHQQQRHRDVGTIRPTGNQLGRISENAPASGGAGFAIFQDGDLNSSNVLDDENNPNAARLAKECDRTKENTMRAEAWNERGYGLVEPSAREQGEHVADSIRGTVRQDAAPRPIQRVGSGAAFDVFVDEEFVDDAKAADERDERRERIGDERTLRQKLDGGAADRLTRDPVRYMKNPAKIESDQRKYDARPERDNRPESGISKSAKSEKADRSKPGGGYDKGLLKPDKSGHECCFEERRAGARYYKLISSSENCNLLHKRTDESDTRNASSMDMEESIDEVDMEEETEENAAAPKPSSILKSTLKSSLRTRKTGDDELENTGTVNPRRVLFGANTNVVFTNEASVNTSTASSQPDESFVRAEETINTRLANAEISMMFSSPANNNASVTDLSFSKPLFSTTNKKDNGRAGPNDDSRPGATALNFSIYHEDDADAENNKDVLEAESHNAILPKKSAGFGIYADDDTETASKPHFGKSLSRKPAIAEPEDNNTASLSLIGDVLNTLGSPAVDARPSSGFAIFADEETKPEVKPPAFEIFSSDKAEENKKPNAPAFEIFADDTGSDSVKKRKTFGESEPCFGDISRIEDEKTGNLLLDDEAAIAAAINYDTRHREDCEQAMRSCLSAAAKSSSRSRLAIHDDRKLPMPRALVRKTFARGQSFKLGGAPVRIVNELGRGVYGVVLLIEIDGEAEKFALKIQAPIGSLAHEYCILQRIEDRLRPNVASFFPYPRPKSLYAFKEGGTFLMTAASYSGFTLLDVVNIFNKIIGKVPELVAIYYTSRMLEHIDTLHREGKVLHNDVKADNWVITSSAGKFDLMLVDFGRSVDLERTGGTSDPIRSQFKGNVAAEDTECVAMRESRPWGIDQDLFGLCSSAHLLLFGSHIEVTEEKSTGKWRLRKAFRRYHQQDLWSCFFETLVNYDSSTDEYCIPGVRVQFEEYVGTRQMEIDNNLNQLFSHLPTKR